MAKSKIIWSGNAKKKLYAILESSIRREKCKTNAKSLYKMISKGVKLLSEQPEVGILTTELPVRCLYIESNLILYETSENRIVIHTISNSSVK